jgi:predicted nicotinamide N-methyase
LNTKHLHQFKGIKILKSSHPEVRKLKKKQLVHCAHGNKIWRSGYVLVDYLETYPLEKKTFALEIGCGWGLVGLYLNKFQEINVDAVDIDSKVMAYHQLHTSINDCKVNFEVCNFEKISGHKLAKYQYVLGSDICFWDELTQPLFELIQRAKESGVKKILISDPGRPPFWKLAELCAQEFKSEVISRRIEKPWNTEKYILVIN